MEYEYQAVDREGQALRGTLEAASPADVARQLARDGRTAVEVKEHRPRSAVPTWHRRLRAADLVVAFRELATLVGSGVTLADAVLAQSRGSGQPVLAAAFANIGQDLLRGKSFGEAVRECSLPLPEYVHQLIEAGELSGELPRSLREAVEQMEYDERVAADMRGALTYPAILVASGIAAVLIVFVVVVPKFSDLLREDANLPLLASAVLGAGVWFNHNTWLFVVLLVGAALGGVALWRSQQARAGVLNGASAQQAVRALRASLRVTSVGDAAATRQWPEGTGQRRRRLKLCPVGPRGGWDARNTTSAAKSNGVLCHSPPGSSMAPASTSASLAGVSMCSLSTGPGMTSFTAMCSAFSSSAKLCTSAHKPLFAAAYADSRGDRFSRAPEPITMILPASDSSRYGIASRAQR